MSFLDFLLSIWSAIWPVRVVRTGWQGVVFRWGTAEGSPREPGVHWIVPTFWGWETRPVTLRWVDLPPQSITTSDGKVLALSANIGFEVVDLVRALTLTDDFETSMARLATGHLHGRVAAWSWDEVMGQRRELEASVLKTLRDRAEPWGVRVVDVRLTDCTPTRVYRLFNEGL